MSFVLILSASPCDLDLITAAEKNNVNKLT